METQELREIVNPVFNTAKSCVQLVAASGDEDAQKLIKALHFEPFGAQISKKPVPPEMLEQVKKLSPAYTVLLETRFQAMNRLIESRKSSQIVDLPCGYTSRGIRMARQGRVYFGFDLPAVIEDIRPAAESIIGENDQISYHAADATNYDSLKAPFSPENQELLITTEGLLMYFSQSELEEVFRNIHRLLQEYGGSWVTTDRAYFLHDRDVTCAALENDAQLTALYEGITKKAAATTADIKFNNNVFFDPDEENIKAFIQKMGFALKEISMGEYLPDKLGSVSGNADLEVRKVFRNMYFWELTVSDQAKDSRTEEKPFSVKTEMSGHTLKVWISGRMDTLTAPELLKKYQEITESIEEIEVDVTDMAYVSSAGLRVLFIMYKALEDKSRFRIIGMSKDIREILETTGFDEFFIEAQ